MMQTNGNLGDGDSLRQCSCWPTPQPAIGNGTIVNSVKVVVKLQISGRVVTPGCGFIVAPEAEK